MNAKHFFLIAAVIVGIAVSGCSSEPAKTEAEQKKAFLGSAPPKGYMNNMGGGNAAPGGAPQAAQEAAAKAAAKAAAEHAGK
jgi:hypothetical protein